MKKIFIIIIFLAIIVGAYFAAVNIITIAVISCQSQYGPCNQKIEERLEAFEGESLYRVQKRVKSTLESEELVSDFSLQLKLPKNLLVNIIERKAKFSLKNEKMGGFAQVDSTGRVLRIDEISSLPYVVVASDIPNVGEMVSGSQLFALNMVYDVFSLYQVREGAMAKDSLTVSLKDGPKVIFPLEGDRQILLASLALILDKLNEGVEGIRINEDVPVLGPVNTIDLRYKNPAIK